jgi:hypothetical protein
MSFTDKKLYKLNHEVLPRDIEKSLPLTVINNIYSFLLPRYCQTPRAMKIERMQLEYNDKVMRYKELMLEKKRRELEKAKKQRLLVKEFDKIIQTLEKLL